MHRTIPIKIKVAHMSRNEYLDLPLLLDAQAFALKMKGGICMAGISLSTVAGRS
jgi:hypothetical protein